ncbi:MAG TPA: hypothetical protein ENK43_03175 [Planctomycetes bacterium]|nr:hypothetical protein [Planctomycetota bacterium]
MHKKTLALFLLLGLSLSAWGQGLPKPEQVVKDIRANLNSKKTWDSVELYGRWDMDHEKVGRAYPPDTAKHPFRCQTGKDDDGAFMKYAGLAIYRRSGPDSWIFNRLFFFEDATEMVGGKGMSKDALFKIAYDGLRNVKRTRAFKLRADRITHVDALVIPDDPKFKQVTADRIEFLAQITYDEATRRSGKSGIQKKSGTFLITAVRQNGQWVMRSSRRKGVLSDLGFTPVPSQTLKNAPSLADMDLESLYGSNSQEMKAPELPSREALRTAVINHYNAGAKQFEALFGSRKADEVTEVESVTPAPFRDGADIDPAHFTLQVELVFRSVTGYGSNFKLVRVRRVAQCTFEKTANGYVVAQCRPVQNTEKTLETVSADSAQVKPLPRAKSILQGGGRLDPTGGSDAPVSTAQSSGPSSSTPAATPPADPTAKDVVAALRRTIDASAKNFGIILGQDMAKKVVDIKEVTPLMKSMTRVDRQSVQVTLTMEFTWKRFDNVLMASRRQYDVKVKAHPKGGWYVTGARQRGREQEVGKVNTDRKAVAAMPLYVARDAKLAKKPKPPIRPAPRRPHPPKRPKAPRGLGGLIRH